MLQLKLSRNLTTVPQVMDIAGEDPAITIPQAH